MKLVHILAVRGGILAEIIRGRLMTDDIVCSTSPSGTDIFNLHSSGISTDTLWDIYIDENKKEDALKIIQEIDPTLIP